MTFAVHDLVDVAPNDWRRSVGYLQQQKPELLAAYLEKHGLDELPVPLVDPDKVDCAFFYQPVKAWQVEGGRQVRYDRISYPHGVHGIVRALEDDWFLIPPDEMPEVESVEPEVEAKAKIRSGPVESLGLDVKPKKVHKRKPFKCEDCGYRTTSKGGLTRHKNTTTKH